MRCTPLRPDVVAVLKAWLLYQPGEPGPGLPQFAWWSSQCRCSSGTGVAQRRNRVSLVPLAEEEVITPHTLRHTAAMSLMHHGVGLAVIALWLGHESSETTQIYLHADMKLKERALAHATASGVAPTRYKPPDPLLAFLEAL